MMENPFEIIIEKLTALETKLESIELGLNFKIGNQTCFEVMSLDQLCEYYGFTKSYIYKQTSLREIPHYKKGKRLYFKKLEIDEWLFKAKIKTMGELQREATKYSLKRLR